MSTAYSYNGLTAPVARAGVPAWPRSNERRAERCLQFAAKTNRDTLLSRSLVLQESYTTEPGRDMAATLDRPAEVRRKEHRLSDAQELYHRAIAMQPYR
jgi:hypothetical protein